MDFDLIVIGAGAVGLAVAAEMAPLGSCLVLEREEGSGRGISSRNSEVVHAGIYYEPGSLKARLCVEGRRRIEAWAAAGHFAYRRVGKVIVATDADECAQLEDLARRARANGVLGLHPADAGELARTLPGVRALAALWSPETGILDSHGFMRFLAERAVGAGADFAFRSRVCALRPVAGGWELDVEDLGPVSGSADPTAIWPGREESPVRLPLKLPPRGECQTVSATRVVNAAGLEADQMAALAGIDVEREGLRQYWSRAEYFAPTAGHGPRLACLVYPVPPAAGGGHLGIHVTVDLAGGLRFGPSAAWLEPPLRRVEDYRQDDQLRAHFAAGIRRYLPDLDPQALVPAGAGLRPRIFGPGEAPRDFYIREESGRGLKGLVNLIGVESPGLTSAPAIACLTRELLLGRRESREAAS